MIGARKAGAQLATTIGAALIVAACAFEPQTEDLTAGPGPSLRLIGSVVLEETDSLYLGKPEVGFRVAEDGTIYVADEFWNRVVGFASDGRLTQVYGRSGSGPGEFRSTTRATLVHDTFLIQPSAARIKVFDLRTGKYLFEHRFQRGYLTDALYHDGNFYLSSFDYTAERAVLRVPAGVLLQPENGPTPEIWKSELVSFPPEYVAYPGLLTFNSSSLAVWQDTMMVGFAGVNYLVRYDLAGIPGDTFDVPVRVRTGVTEVGLRQFQPGAQSNLDKEMRAISDLKQMWRMPSGDFVLWHQDGRAETRGRNVQVFGDAYISIVSRDLSRACVDTKVPFPGTDWPRFAMRADTLFAMDQVSAQGDSLSATTIVAKYVIETTNCAWLPVGRRVANKRPEVASVSTR